MSWAESAPGKQGVGRHSTWWQRRVRWLRRYRLGTRSSTLNESLGSTSPSNVPRAHVTDSQLESTWRTSRVRRSGVAWTRRLPKDRRAALGEAAMSLMCAVGSLGSGSRSAALGLGLGFAIALVVLYRGRLKARRGQLMQRLIVSVGVLGIAIAVFAVTYFENLRPTSSRETTRNWTSSRGGRSFLYFDLSLE